MKYNLYEAQNSLIDYSSIEMIYENLIPQIKSNIGEAKENLLCEYINIIDNKNNTYTVFVELEKFEQDLSSYRDKNQFVMYDEMMSFIQVITYDIINFCSIFNHLNYNTEIEYYYNP